MNPLDLLILAAALVAVVAGWRMGFLARAFGWAGAGVGVVAALVLVPRLVERLDLESRAVVAVTSALAALTLVTLGQGVGAAIGARLRPGASVPHWRLLDAAGGAALGMCVVAVLVWLLVPVLARTDGWTASLARNSRLAELAARYLPEPPPVLDELQRRLETGDFPELFADLEPAPELPPPPEGSAIDAAQLASLAAGVVRVEGEACDSLQTGSGFAIAPGLVVTNAHVVAGTGRSELETPDGRRGSGRVVAFDPSIDLAVVATDLELEVLPTGTAAVGDTGLVLGFPGGGPLDPSPFAVGELLRARGLDIYDRAQVERSLVVLAAELAPGDSGSAVVRDDGRVVAVAVAIAPDRPGVAYALRVEDVLDDLERVSGPVDTGACLA